MLQKVQKFGLALDHVMALKAMTPHAMNAGAERRGEIALALV
jgi:hypothetical protein